MIDKNKQRYIYFARPIGGDGRIKIGCSYNPAKRLVALASWSAYPIEIIAVAAGGFADEKMLHQFFADDRLHCEWFRASDDLHFVIEAMSRARLSASDAIAALPSRRKAAA